jgi:CubicO group peptidase (beta-lactamase class C family)
VAWNRRSFLVGAGVTASVSALASNSFSAGAPNEALDVPAELQPLIEQERKRILALLDKEGIPGAAVCLIHQGNRVWVEGFGVIDNASSRKVSAHTIFSIQSTSKNVTATAILIAVQRGLLDLDRPISAYLPDFTVQSRFEQRPEQKMTLRLLLSHRAGFTHEAPIGNNYDPPFPDFDAHVRSISRTWLRYPVGQRYSYSNLGFDLAGYILQTVSKTPFAECLKSMIFDRLAMSDSTASTDVYARRRDRAVGHEKGYAAVPLKIPLIPSGGVYVSAHDVATYVMFHLNRGKVEGRTILEEKIWREMHSFSFGGNYSLGVARAELRYGDTAIRMLNHNGGGFGFGSVLNIYPEIGLAWVALFNRSADAGYQLGAEPQQEILTRQFGEQKPRLPIQDLSAIDPQRETLERFVGNWRGRTLSGDIKIENDALGIQLGPVLVPLKFTSPRDLFMPLPQPRGEALMFRYFEGNDRQTAYLESPVGDVSLDYNDGPHDLPGEDKKAWDAYLGKYEIEQWGKPSRRVKIARKNGYLYLDEVRLIVEFEPGLFFTSDGEAVDFRNAPPTWRNIRLVRAGA